MTKQDKEFYGKVTNDAYNAIIEFIMIYIVLSIVCLPYIIMSLIK